MSKKFFVGNIKSELEGKKSEKNAIPLELTFDDSYNGSETLNDIVQAIVSHMKIENGYIELTSLTFNYKKVKE